jgi:hypothetical protein
MFFVGNIISMLISMILLFQELIQQHDCVRFVLYSLITRLYVGKSLVYGWPHENSCASLLCQAKLRIEIYFVVFYCKKEKRCTSAITDWWYLHVWFTLYPDPVWYVVWNCSLLYVKTLRSQLCTFSAILGAMIILHGAYTWLCYHFC